MNQIAGDEENIQIQAVKHSTGPLGHIPLKNGNVMKDKNGRGTVQKLRRSKKHSSEIQESSLTGFWILKR